MNELFSIGDPGNPTQDDERFASREDAIRAAVKRSWDDHVWAVWEDNTGEIIALVFAQDVYQP